MKFLIPFIITIIAGLSTVFGYFAIYIKPKNIKKFISFSLSFSATIMILISITDLIPTSFFTIIENVRIGRALIIMVLCFFSGAYLINIVDKKIEKYEKNNDLYKVGILSAIVLMLHNLPEGIATFLSSCSDLKLGVTLSLAIMMHNIPEGICIAVPIYYSTHDKSRALKTTFLSGMSEVMGALISFIFLSRFITITIISFVLIMVSGIMISLAINQIYKEAFKYNKNLAFYLGIVLGFIFILIQHLLF